MGLYILGIHTRVKASTDNVRWIPYTPYYFQLYGTKAFQLNVVQLLIFLFVLLWLELCVQTLITFHTKATNSSPSLSPVCFVALDLHPALGLISSECLYRGSENRGGCICVCMAVHLLKRLSWLHFANKWGLTSTPQVSIWSLFQCHTILISVVFCWI